MLKKILKSLFVIIGTLIGAGFASGQEIYIFFYKYGTNGIIGIAISSLLIGAIVYKVLEISRKRQIKNYKEFVGILVKNENQIKIFNTIINIFILITFYIMIAGFGAYFEQQFGIDSLIGSSILAMICYFVFLKDVTGLIKVNQLIVPILIVGLILVGINVIDFARIPQISKYILQNSSYKWILDSILYGSYNTILLIPVLIALKNLITKKKESIFVSILTIITVILLSLIIFLMLSKIDVNIENLEMPTVYVVSKISNIFKYIYGFIILSSILTTSVSLGTSFLENVAKNKNSNKKYAILICISAVVVSKIGFSNLVNLLYPIFGYIGLIQVIACFFVHDIVEYD